MRKHFRLSRFPGFSRLSQRAKAAILAALGVLLALLAVFSAWKLLDIRVKNDASQKKFDQLLKADTDPAPTSSLPGDETAVPDGKAAAIAQLFRDYPDMVGWLSIDGTRLDYPVMQTPESPNYYLRRDMDGAYDFYGVPYMNEACDLQDSDNLIVYGHSIDNGDVFGSLLQYSAQDYFDRHPVIDLYTREGLRQYTVLGAFITDVTPETGDSFAYNDFICAGSRTAYDSFVANVRARAYYPTDTAAAYGDQLLTLSTCEYTLPDGRFVVVAVRTDQSA